MFSSPWLLPRPVICGLLPIYPGSQREDYPLLSAKVHYDLSDVQMLANLIQTYTSNASIDAEIRYVLPLPADASVCAFKAVIDGERTIRGIVKEKAKAKAEYKEAVAQGKTAALLEQDNVEIFQVSLGNIRPKQTIEVHVSFVSVISHDGSLDSLRLTFPSTIAPRYGTPPGGMFGSYGFKFSNDTLAFSVAVEMASHIKSITSPSHPIAMKLGESTAESSNEFDPKKAHVSLSSPSLLDKDIVLVLSCQGLDKPRCMVESFSPEEGGQECTDAYALTLVPRFELPSLPAQEYIFLVDRSGSMGGPKMNAVRSALQILLMSLPSRGTCFNIMSFGSQYSLLWQHSQIYSAGTVRTASDHVDSMSANFGGTEIREAIKAAFDSLVARPNSETTSTSVFVLTDGQAYDLEGVQSTIQDTVEKAKADGVLLRVFCMGIGNAVSKAMCDKIARAGKGTAVFVGEEEKPDQKLMGLLRAARGAAVEDISIDWGVGEDDASETDSQSFEMVPSRDDSPGPPKPVTPISLFDESNTASSEKDTTSLGPQTIHVQLPPPPRVQQAPATNSLPPLYPGFRTSLFAIVRRGEGGNTAPSKSVRISGSVLGRPVVLEVPISQTSKPTSNTPIRIKMLHSLAARALIQSFEDKAATSKPEVADAEVLRLAERYRLASSQTSFIAVDEQGRSFDAITKAAAVTTSLFGGGATASSSAFGPVAAGFFGAQVPTQGGGVTSFGFFGSQPTSSQGFATTSVFGNTQGSSQGVGASNTPGGFSAALKSSQATPFGSGVPFSSSTAPVPSQTFGTTSFGSGSMFGNAPTGVGSGVFGSAPAASGTFGAAPSGAGNLFGPASSQGFGTTSFGSGGILGNTPTSDQGVGGGLFGGSSAAPGSSQAFGAASFGAGILFGSSAPSASSQAFGNTSFGSGNIFSNAFDQDTKSSVFGGSSAAPASSQAFGTVPSETGNIFGSSSTASEPHGILFSTKSNSPAANPPATSGPLSSSIETFARTQSFDGSFTASASLLQLLFGQSQPPAIPPALESAGTNADTLWCTLLCVAYLESKFADDKEIWIILAEKAMDFVQDTLHNVGFHDARESVQELKQTARKCFA